MWTSASDIVAAMGSGLSLLMEPPLSYVLVFGFIMAGLKFASGLVNRKKG